MKITSSIPKSETIKIPKIQGSPAIVGSTISDESGAQYVVQGFQPVNGVVRILAVNIETATLWSLDPAELTWVEVKPTVDEVANALYSFEVNRIHCHCEDDRPDKAIEEFSMVMQAAYNLCNNNPSVSYEEFVKTLSEALGVPELKPETIAEIEAITEAIETAIESEDQESDM